MNWDLILETRNLIRGKSKSLLQYLENGSACAKNSHKETIKHLINKDLLINLTVRSTYRYILNSNCSNFVLCFALPTILLVVVVIMTYSSLTDLKPDTSGWATRRNDLLYKLTDCSTTGSV